MQVLVQAGLSVILVAASIFTPSSATAAQTRIVELSSNLGPVIREVDPNGLVTQEYILANPNLDVYATTHAKAGADFGILRASTFAQASGGGSANAFALAEFKDTLKITSGALNGSAGYARFDIFYNWTFSNTTNTNVSVDNRANLLLDFGGSTAYAGQRKVVVDGTGGLIATETREPIVVSDGAISDGALLGTYFSVLMPMIFGTDYNISLALSVGSAASRGTASVNSLNSVY